MRECFAKNKEHGCRLALFPKIWVTILRRVSKTDYALLPLSFSSYFIFILTKCSWNQHKLALLKMNLTVKTNCGNFKFLGECKYDEEK